jgi:glutamate-1-semialdehyde 2,1-aminomutase
MAGGWPVSALAGKAELMDLIGDRVVHAGTFNSSVPACAAVIATLTALRTDPPYQRVEEHGTALMRRIRSLAASLDSGLRVQGLPAAFHVSFGDGEPVRVDYGRGSLALPG